jgi:hypothetical protein
MCIGYIFSVSFKISCILKWTLMKIAAFLATGLLASRLEALEILEIKLFTGKL